MVKKWQLNRKVVKSRFYLKKGVLATITGEWKKAEKNLTKSLKVKNSDIWLINYLACAYFADKQGNHEKCDNYLSMASVTDKKYIY